jgi:hypothetical protein
MGQLRDEKAIRVPLRFTLICNKGCAKWAQFENCRKRLCKSAQANARITAGVTSRLPA